MPRTTIPTYEVALVGWARENPVVPIVLLSLRERTKLDVKLGQPVKVKKGRTSVIATVQMQFKEALGVDGFCSINTKLKDDIGYTEGDKLKIDKAVTESEYKAFQEQSAQAMRSGIMEALLSGLQGNQPIEGDGA